MFSPELRLRAAAKSCLLHLVLLTLSFLWVLPASAAPKTDTVYFKNGDKLTGEVKSLRRGRLSLNTDATGTIGIEWEKISAVVSNQNIQIETVSGIRYFGHLSTSEDGSPPAGFVERESDVIPAVHVESRVWDKPCAGGWQSADR